MTGPPMMALTKGMVPIEDLLELELSTEEMLNPEEEYYYDLFDELKF